MVDLWERATAFWPFKATLAHISKEGKPPGNPTLTVWSKGESVPLPQYFIWDQWLRGTLRPIEEVSRVGFEVWKSGGDIKAACWVSLCAPKLPPQENLPDQAVSRIYRRRDLHRENLAPSIVSFSSLSKGSQIPCLWKLTVWKGAHWPRSAICYCIGAHTKRGQTSTGVISLYIWSTLSKRADQPRSDR